MRRGFYDRSSRWILLAVAISFPLLVISAGKTVSTARNDVQDWLPDSFEETHQYADFQKHFAGETFILASWEGCTLDDPSVEKLAQALEADWCQAQHPDDGDGLFLRIGSGPRLLEELTSPPSSLSEERVRQRLKGLMIGPDDEQTAVLISLAPLGKKNFPRTVSAVYQTAEETLGLTRDELKLAGSPVDNTAIDDEGNRTLHRLVVASCVAGLLLSYWCMRHLGLTILLFMASILSATLSMAIVSWAGVSMDAILFTMPTVVYTASLSGAIHIINYYRHSVPRLGFQMAVGEAVRRSLMPCFLSAATTSVGLGSLFVSQIAPIRKFGLFSAIGVLATLAVLFLFVPAILSLFPPRRDRHCLEPHADDEQVDMPAKPTTSGRVAHFLTARHTLLFVLFHILLLIFGAGLLKVRTTVDLLALFTSDAEIIRNYRWMEERLGVTVPVEIVVRVKKDSPMTFLERLRMVERIEKRVREVEGIGNVQSAATFAPDFSQPTNRRRGVLGSLERIAVKNRQTTRDDVLNRRLQKHREQFVKNEYLSEEGDEELWRVNCRLGALSGMDFVSVQEGITEVVHAEFEKHPNAGLSDSSYVITGLAPLVNKTQKVLLSGLISSFITAFALIAVVMMVIFRSFTAGLLTMLPNVWPVAMVMGLLGHLGILIDIGTMMTASVAMGVCVDDTVHFATWFRHGLRKGLTQKLATEFAYRNCARAMFHSSLVVGLGLLAFSLSSFMPTRRFGILMAALLSAGLLADLVLTPCILAGPLGKFFTNLGRSKPNSPEAETRGEVRETAASAETV